MSASGRVLRASDEALLELARGGDEAAFAELAGRFRGELQFHCYRIVGSAQDAEDLVQETLLLAAWRALERFEGRASLRSWLYRIATNLSLNGLRDKSSRPRELAAPPDGAPRPPPPTRLGEPVWLEPYPDSLLEGVSDRSLQPGARYEAREAIGLAFVVALQRLLPRQRAVLVLRDVLAFRAREVAEMLGTSEVSVNRTLQRARTAIERTVPPGQRDLTPLPGSREERELVGRFTASFEAGDVPGLIALLTGDALLTMPPEPLEYEGPHAIGKSSRRFPPAGGSTASASS